VLAGGGALDVMLKLTVHELMALTGGIPADICAAKGEHHMSLRGGGGGGDQRGSWLVLLIPLPPPPTSCRRPSPPTVAVVQPESTAGGHFSPHTGTAAASERSAMDISHPSGEASSHIPWMPIPRPRFLIDAMMGRLTRWLRVIGVDAESTVGPGADEFMTGWRAEKGLPPPPLPPPPPFVNKRGGGPVFAKAVSAPVMGGSGSSASGGMDVDAMVEWANRSGRILVTRDRKVRRCQVAWCDALCQWHIRSCVCSC